MEAKTGIELQDRVAFTAALKNGLGFTRACGFIMQRPDVMTEYVTSNPEFYQECIQAIKFSAKALLVMSNTYLEKKQFEKWLNNNEYVKAFVSRLVLWGEYSDKDSLDEQKLIRAWHRYKDFDEMATACSMLKDEMIDFILNNEKLDMFFSRLQIV